MLLSVNNGWDKVVKNFCKTFLRSSCLCKVHSSTWTCLAIANWTMVVSSCQRDSHRREI